MRVTVLLGLLLALVGSPAWAQRAAPGTIDEAMEAALSQAITPGAVVAVVVRDSIAFIRAYSRTSFEEGAAPLTEDALFQAGGLSELVNALAAARLAHAGKVTLDAPIGALMPELPRELRDITLDQLLTHTGGLSYQLAVPGRGGADDLGAAARGLTPLDRVAPAGTLYSFSTPGIRLAGLAIERAAKQPYAAAVHEAVLEPLGMLRSTFDFAVAGPDLTPGWQPSLSVAARVMPAALTRDTAMHVPLRGFHTTAVDAARLAAALLSDGVVAGERRLPPGVAAALLESRADIPFSTSSAGRGIRISQPNGRRRVTIAGGSRGHGVTMELLPEHRLGVVVLTNKSGDGLPGVAEFVFDRLLGDVAAPPRKAVAPENSGSLEELAARTGRYLNGAELIEIVEQDGSPMLRSGDLLMPIRVLDSGTFGALIQDRVALVFRMISDPDVTWLWIDDRAFAREERK